MQARHANLSAFKYLPSAQLLHLALSPSQASQSVAEQVKQSVPTSPWPLAHFVHWVRSSLLQPVQVCASVVPDLVQVSQASAFKTLPDPQAVHFERSPTHVSQFVPVQEAQSSFASGDLPESHFVQISGSEGSH